MAVSNIEPSEYYGALQEIVDDLFGDPEDSSGPGYDDPHLEELLAPKVRRLDVIMKAESTELPEDLMEIVQLLPPGDYTRSRLCTQLNSAITGHAWGQVYGTVL